MIPLFSTSQIRTVDGFAINKLGIPGIVLMENASREIFSYAHEKISQFNKTPVIGFICGRGNNGGDGFATARHFVNAGFKVKVLYLADESKMSPGCSLNFHILKKMSRFDKNPVLQKYRSNRDLNFIKNCSVIIDAMLVSGMKGELKEPYKSIVKILNKSEAYNIAIDIPTGLDSDTGFGAEVFNADLTVTLGEFKTGLFFGTGAAVSGEVQKGGIGVSNSYFNKFKPTAYLIEPEDAYYSLPLKKKDIHKYSAGKVLTIAGSEHLPGAAVLTAKSAFRIGAGASILAFPKSIRSFIQKKLAEVVVNSYDDESKGFISEQNIAELKKRINWADVVALGPGLGREAATRNAVIKLIKNRLCNRMVIDADAVAALGGKLYRKLNLKNYVLTPHHAEFASMLGIQTDKLKQDILKYGKAFVKTTGAYLVLKGAPTIIFTPKQEIFINTTGNPGMAKFGTGDVLTGTIAGLMSQQKDIEKAVVSAVFIHSLAADLLLDKFTDYGYTATDILNNLPSAIRFLRKSIV